MERIEEIEILKIQYMKDKIWADKREADGTATQGDDYMAQESAKKLRKALVRHGREQSTLVWDMPYKYLKIADTWKNETPDKSTTPDKPTRLDHKISLGDSVTLEPGSSSDTTLMTINLNKIQPEFAKVILDNRKAKSTPSDGYPF